MPSRHALNQIASGQTASALTQQANFWHSNLQLQVSLCMLPSCKAKEGEERQTPRSFAETVCPPKSTLVMNESGGSGKTSSCFAAREIGSFHPLRLSCAVHSTVDSVFSGCRPATVITHYQGKCLILVLARLCRLTRVTVG